MTIVVLRTIDNIYPHVLPMVWLAQQILGGHSQKVLVALMNHSYR